MPRLTGSGLPIARHCGWSFREDAEYLPRPEGTEDDEYRQAGLQRHDAFASYVDSGVWPLLPFDMRRLADQVERFWAAEERAGFRAEVSFALDPVSGKAVELGAHLGRDYLPAMIKAAGPAGLVVSDLIPMTVDYVGVNGGMLVVGDWKNDQGGYVEPPDANLQLLAGAAAAALALGHERVLVEICIVREEGVIPLRFLAGPTDLFQAAREIAGILERLPLEAAKPGPHCRWCPALGGCPATRSAIEAVHPESLVGGIQWGTAFLSVENDAAMVMNLIHVENAVKAIKDALKKRYTVESPLPLPNGKVWRPTLSSRRGLDTEKVKAFLGDRLPEFEKVSEFEKFAQVKP